MSALPSPGEEGQIGGYGPVFVIVILGALALYWYFFENIEASQKTVAVTAVAPKATAPRLIPPGK
jgi:hypothetical protein